MKRGRPEKLESGKRRLQSENARPSPLTPAERPCLLTMKDTEPEPESPFGYGCITINGVYRQIGSYSWQECVPVSSSQTLQDYAQLSPRDHN